MPPLYSLLRSRRSWLAQHLACAPLACLFLLLLLVSACAGKQEQKIDYVPPGRTACKVEQFTLKGVEVVDEEELLDGLATQEDPGWRTKKVIRSIPVIGAESEYFNSVEFDRDIERIQTFYQMHGYYNAQVVGQTISRCIPGQDVTITLTIDEGLPTGIASIAYEGLDNEPELLSEVRRAVKLKPDAILVQEDYLRAKERIVATLRQRSHAYARVTGRVIVNPRDRSADITFFVDPGPSSFFEKPTITGLERVDDDYVRDAITFDAGEPYSAEALQQTQEQLYDLGVFSLVTVQPDFRYQRDEEVTPGDGRVSTVAENIELGSEEQDFGALGISDILGDAQADAEERTNLSRRVPITIKVKEAKNWTGRVGAGFSINSTRQDVHGAFNVTSRNFLGKLGKLEQFNTLGYALTPGLLQVLERRAQNSDLTLDEFGNRGVFFDILLRYSQPQLFERLTTGFLQTKVTRDIQENYIGLIPSGSIGLRRQLFTRKLQAEISYNVLFIRYQNFPDDFARELRAQGLDPRSNNGRPSLLLEYLEQKIIYDGRDSPINPTRGIRAQVSMQEARRYIVGGEYSYLKPQFEVDGYIPIGKGLVSAARFGLGSIYNTNPVAGDQTLGIPLQARLFGGGKGSVRSFGPRYFGYFTDDLIDPGPIGANTLLEVGLEQRIRIRRNFFEVGDLWGAVFSDVGSFTNAQLIFDTPANQFGTTSLLDLGQTLVTSAGAGVYWITPVGPLRADFALTLTDLEQDPRFGPDPTVRDDPNTLGNERILEERYSRARLNKVRGFDFYLGIGHSF